MTNLISILSTTLLIVTIGTMLLAIVSYISFRLKDSKNNKSIKHRVKVVTEELIKSGASLDEFYKLKTITNVQQPYIQTFTEPEPKLNRPKPKKFTVVDANVTKKYMIFKTTIPEKLYKSGLYHNNIKTTQNKIY